MELPEKFVESLSELPGLDREAFVEAMQQPPAVSLKLNRRKCADPSELGYGGMSRVPWCSSGYYLPERPLFTLNPLLHGGVFYVQDASSMIHEEIVRRLGESHGLPEDALVLDLCAAPGGKATSIINALPDCARIVANEVMPQRARVLRENLVKWGFPGVTVTNSPTSRFAALGETFDLIAVDAPCSGEGMMRKDEDARSQWGPGLVAQCASLQREILADAVEALQPGGFLIYSTCTFNRHENEENVAWLVEEMGLEPVDLEIPSEWWIGSGIATPYPVLRFMPHLTRGEGLFAAVLRKKGERQEARGKSWDRGENNKGERQEARGKSWGRGESKKEESMKGNQGDKGKKKEGLKEGLKVILEGVPAAVMKGKTEMPAPESALFSPSPADKLPHIDVDKETALRYLRHEAIRLADDAPRGFVVICFGGHPLGLAKNIGNRANNLYPSDWRIRMEIGDRR